MVLASIIPPSQRPMTRYVKSIMRRVMNLSVRSLCGKSKKTMMHSVIR